MTKDAVTRRLASFVHAARVRGLPGHVTREANRLLVNQLKASVGAASHPAIIALRGWARDAGGAGAHLLWFGDAASAESACFVNAALFEVLDFNETYIPTFQHAVSGVLPAVLAMAEARGSSGAEVLTALALGIEAELACAAILMPTGYYRGFVPGGITGAIGGAVACALLRGLDVDQTCDAVGLAMNFGAGFYHSAGSAALPAIMGNAARNGFLACELAARGLDAPESGFEGDKGMLSAYSDEPAEKIAGVMDDLGTAWRIMGQSYKTAPTETITHAPLECVRVLRARARGRMPNTLRFGVSAIVVGIAQERASRFGAPSTDLEARFDMRFCAAAAWLRGRFTLAEMTRDAFTDPAILALRERVELVADAEHPTFEGASLDLLYADGSADRVVVPAFLGTQANPLSDADLSELLREAASGLVSPSRIDALLDAAWSLPTAASVSALLQAATLDEELP